MKAMLDTRQPSPGLFGARRGGQRLGILDGLDLRLELLRLLRVQRLEARHKQVWEVMGGHTGDEPPTLILSYTTSGIVTVRLSLS